MKLTMPLSKNESDLIKGIAMLMIIFHNYFHIIPPYPGENQFYFDDLNMKRLSQLVWADPMSLVRYSLSYFGHYGVQLFIFTSGYGLYISQKSKEVGYFEFLVGKIKKLYPTLLIIVLVLLVIIPLWQKMVDPEIVRSLLLKLTLFFNFIPGEALAVTGPFWFFSLIFQLYIIFPVLFYLMERYGQKILYWVSGVCLAITILFNDYFVAKDVSLLVLFVGQLPIFCMGIYFASRPVNRLPFALILTAIFIFAIGNVNRFIWHFSFLAFTLFMLSFLISIFPILKRSGKIYSFLLFSGSISLYLFAVHGVTRIPFEYLSEKYDNSFITTILSFIYLGGVYILASFVRAFDQKVQKVI